MPSEITAYGVGVHASKNWLVWYPKITIKHTYEYINTLKHIILLSNAIQFQNGLSKIISIAEYI